MRPLIGIPSPRDIPEFKEHIDKLRVDKLWLKYQRELDAYTKMREYFLKHKQYTHLIPVPDDLIVKQYDLTRLLTAIRRRDYPVISGICNIDSKPENKGKYNICDVRHLPSVEPHLRQYVWMTTRSKLIRKGQPFRVSFMGFALPAIRRDVIEKIPFRNDGYCCLDTMFCWDCAQAKIPIFVDPKINMFHMKISDGNYQNYGVDTKKAITYLEKVKT